MALILVVDDDEGIRRVVEVMLKNAGHDPVLAVNGNDALRQFRQQHFDLVICDIFMPDKEGIETLRELRQLDPAVPIIMMSGGAAHKDYLAVAEHFGATRTIAKPFRYSQLTRLVRECLARA